ncbi:interferon-inducible GTPase-domain-containing protein [Tricharina praecox]|uniref:interferon-inducible GTPase-domain-containing protein n=1 Tax=Tricharina praecox TaxID=43433 RepID=UPI002220E9A7|nr:interferon-inducible GTPase-domain-containing protein [Tricharina praecox]KAI5855526.1 interferon-inducible GTPase-domain-containing protein [Tricharina praecox]
MWAFVTAIARIAIPPIVQAVASLFMKPPDSQNQTMGQIQARIQEEDRESCESNARRRQEQHKENLAAVRMMEERLAKMEADARQSERDTRAARERVQAAEEESRRIETEVREAREARERAHTAELARMEENVRRNEKEMLAAKERAQAAEEEVQGKERQAQEAQERAHAAEEAAFKQQENSKVAAAKAKREAKELKRRFEETKENLKNGIQPEVWPTKKELEDAKIRLGYRDDRLHFAVSGPSGSGKSSLINAFRGLTKKSPHAAPVGIVETTSIITRYPDNRQEMPYQRFVWYDVPGAGTINIPSWQYFNTQGLFIFDFIILVYDARFTQIDADILENCRRFNIPAFIVRSKANQHIRNMMDEDDDLELAEAREMFIKETRQNLASNLEKRQLSDANTRCYIVSSNTLYDLIRSARATGDAGASARKTRTDEYIDEEQLLVDILDTAVKRRYTSAT